MPRKPYSPEQIITILHEADVRLSQGETVGQICRTLAVSEQSYYRWRQEFGGLKVDQARRLKDLERENLRLRKAVADHDAGCDDLEGSCTGIRVSGCAAQLLSPSRRRACVDN